MAGPTSQPFPVRGWAHFAAAVSRPWGLVATPFRHLSAILILLLLWRWGSLPAALRGAGRALRLFSAVSVGDLGALLLSEAAARDTSLWVLAGAGGVPNSSPGPRTGEVEGLVAQGQPVNLELPAAVDGWAHLSPLWVPTLPCPPSCSGLSRRAVTEAWSLGWAFWGRRRLVLRLVLLLPLPLLL